VNAARAALINANLISLFMMFSCLREVLIATLWPLAKKKPGVSRNVA
jgi:hypothetical protein